MQSSLLNDKMSKSKVIKLNMMFKMMGKKTKRNLDFEIKTDEQLTSEKAKIINDMWLEFKNQLNSM